MMINTASGASLSDGTGEVGRQGRDSDASLHASPV